MKKTCFGLIVGNRDFFPDSLVASGRERIMNKLEEMGFEVICLSPADTKLGAVETFSDARKCAKLFAENANKIDGIIVTLPNFGDEKSIAQAIRMSDLNVPVLVHAFNDDPEKLDLANRRDSFCGKISVCNNLKQFGIPFSLTSKHTEDVDSAFFEQDIEWFASVCSIVRSLKRVRIGAVGARPNAFNTVRFSEKLLEAIGVSVETIDLSEILFKIQQIKDRGKIDQWIEDVKKRYVVRIVPREVLETMARLSLVLEEWIEENQIDAVAIQCWTILEKQLHITPCTVMSLLSERLKPSACEVDVMGALSMYILQAASGKPSAIVDWNNNYTSDDETILFHCGNFPVSIYETAEIRFADVIGTTVGSQNAYGACAGKIKSGPFTFFRLSSNDLEGKLIGYVGEGEIVPEDPKTFGSRGIARVEKLQELMNYICSNGFEHHVAINLSRTAKAIKEALEKYKGIEIYWHRG
jgi:L-fucose isomerase-like protein